MDAALLFFMLSPVSLAFAPSLPIASLFLLTAGSRQTQVAVAEAEINTNPSCDVALKKYSPQSIRSLYKKFGRIACIQTQDQRTFIGYFRQIGSMMEIYQPDPDSMVKVSVNDVRKVTPQRMP